MARFLSATFAHDSKIVVATSAAAAAAPAIIVILMQASCRKFYLNFEIDRSLRNCTHLFCTRERVGGEKA
jgi:hypothetical protein